MSTSSSTDPNATPELDNATELPARNRASFVTILAVQALNAFNDNFVKMLLVAFAGAVAKGTDLGDSMQVYLGAIFSVPYVLFAPIAGWLSDRYSKQRVIFWMQVTQVLVFGTFIGAIWMKQTQLTLWLSLVSFFLMATQAAFFSPAKMGIMKELVGSRRLGGASGWLQMTNFVGILAGMWAGGTWFGARLAAGHDEWSAVWLPLLVVSGVAFTQIIGALGVQRTPEHEEVKFERAVLWEHFAQLKLLFSDRPIKLAAIGITYFWFMSNAVGSILVTLSREIHPESAADASKALSNMAAMLGVGIMVGSMIAGMVCRRRVELGLVPMAGMGLALCLLWAGLLPLHSSWLLVSMVGVGIASGCFMTPLYAYVQDRAKSDERARILAAMNLMDCIGGIVANIILVKAMLLLRLPASVQLLVLVVPGIGAALFITQLLPQPLLKLTLGLVVRAVYRLKAHHTNRLVRKGAVLIMPNHVSYADAIILGSVCDRDGRFVMFDYLYNTPSIRWALKILGTVPISRTKAKEAIRSVAETLKHGHCVCLYPEGQITRTGFLNEITKGYELMARLGGNVMVQPVWIDGLWGSIFSFEGGRFFKKTPKAMPYNVSGWFGEPMPAKEANAARVREVLTALSAEAFADRELVKKTPQLVMPDGSVMKPGEAHIAHASALRILDTSLLQAGDTILCLLPPEHAMSRVFAMALPALHILPVQWQPVDSKERAGRILAIGDRTSLKQVRAAHSGSVAPWDLAVEISAWGTWDGDEMERGDNVYPALFDPDTSALLTLSVPDPMLAPGDEGNQHGHKAGSKGHILPGIGARNLDDALILSGVIPGSLSEVRLEKAYADDEGFVFVRNEVSPVCK